MISMLIFTTHNVVLPHDTPSPTGEREKRDRKEPNPVQLQVQAAGIACDFVAVLIRVITSLFPPSLLVAAVPQNTSDITHFVQLFGVVNLF